MINGLHDRWFQPVKNKLVLGDVPYCVKKNPEYNH